jgi:hypothetical protein
MEKVKPDSPFEGGKGDVLSFAGLKYAGCRVVKNFSV